MVRRALTALDGRDVEAYLEQVSPQIELISFASPLQGQGPITGHEGVRDYFHELSELLGGEPNSKSRR